MQYFLRLQVAGHLKNTQKDQSNLQNIQTKVNQTKQFLYLNNKQRPERTCGVKPFAPKMKSWLKRLPVPFPALTSKIGERHGDSALSIRGVHQGHSSIWWDIDCIGGSLLHLSIHYSSLHPSFLGCRPFFPQWDISMHNAAGPPS